MAIFEVTGGTKLKGSITPQGAKNEALQIIAATLLTSDTVTINNIPDIKDVNIMIDILRDLGVIVTKNDRHSYTFRAAEIVVDRLREPEVAQKMGKIRGSVLLTGSLLGRMGKAYMPQPGGDKIGTRRLDTHINALEQLGVRTKIDEGGDAYYFELKNTHLQGAGMVLDEPSVTGTANVVMAAVLAKGKTSIYNAACEPYVQQLCTMLNRMGAKISGIGSNWLHIEGVDSLHGTEHKIMPDMIEIGSFIGMAAMTQSEITIKDVVMDDLGIIPNTFRKIGVDIEVSGRDIVVPEKRVYEITSYIGGSILSISDHPWPGLTPDLLSIFLVVATQAKGSVLIHQKMFESRLFFVDKVIEMGARIVLCDPHRAVVVGLERKSQLRGITMTSPDIRAGVALLIAAMGAKGKSTIHNIDQIDRGYEDIDLRLNALGAKIKRL